MMDRREEKEAAELQSRIDSNERPSVLKPTAKAIVNFDVEGFIGDVINSVNDATIGGFNNMEEFAAKTLKLQGADRRALSRGVDSIYHQIQDGIDSSLLGWETLLQKRYFNFSPDPQIDYNDSENKQFDNLDLEEENLDSELSISQNQLISARREGAKLRRELSTLEKHSALRNELGSEMKSLDETFDGMFKSATVMRNTITKAKGILHDEVIAVHADSSPEKNMIHSLQTNIVDGDSTVHNILE